MENDTASNIFHVVVNKETDASLLCALLKTCAFNKTRIANITKLLKLLKDFCPG